MYRAIIPSLMRFMVLSSLVVLTAMSLLIHGVQGIRHIRRDSLAPLEHQTAHQDVTQAFVSSPPAGTGGTNFKDTDAEMMVVVRGRRQALAIRQAASGKNKFHQQQHHHWMPSIHEDYFGPRHHKAAHH